MNLFLKFIVVGLLFSGHLFSMEASTKSRRNSSTTKNEWPRVKETLSDSDIRLNIRRLAIKYPTLKLVNPDLERLSGHHLVWDYWRVLYAIRADTVNKIGRNTRDYFLIYEAISKLFLSREIFPRNYYHDNYEENHLVNNHATEQFIDPLITKLGEIDAYCQNDDRHGHKDKKEETWAKRYRGELLMLKAKKFLSCMSVDWKNSLDEATRIFKGLVSKSVTKTNSLLLAELILDYDIIPSGMTSELAISYANYLIEKALFAEHQSSSSKSRTHNEKDALERAAQPKYMKEINHREYGQRSEDQDALEIVILPEIADGEDDSSADEAESLVGANFSIPLRNDANLPANSRVRHLIKPKEMTVLRFKGRHVTRYNVSGGDHNCFFNAIGKRRTNLVNTLLDRLDDENIRFLIANEIVNLAIELTGNVQTAVRIDQEILNRIQFDRFKQTLGQLAQREEARNNILSTGHEVSDQGLSVANLRRERETEIAQLHIRASQKDVCKLYLKKHAQPNGEMMNFERTLEGALQHSQYTVVDAFAFVSDMGLRIYQIDDELADSTELTLTHEFIPENAAKIAHIFYANHHFQILLFRNVVTRDSHQAEKEQETPRRQEEEEEEKETNDDGNSSADEYNVELNVKDYLPRERGRYWLGQKENIQNIFNSLKRNFVVIVNGEQYEIPENCEDDDRIWRKIANIYNETRKKFYYHLDVTGIRKRPARTEWNKERIATLRTKVREQKSIDNICNEMETDRRTLKDIAAQNNIKIPKRARRQPRHFDWTKRNEEIATTMIRRGQSITAIAKKLDFDRHAVSRRLEELGEWTKKRASTFTWKGKDNLLISYREKKKWSAKEIAHKFGTTQKSVESRLAAIDKENRKRKRQREDSGLHALEHDDRHADDAQEKRPTKLCKK